MNRTFQALGFILVCAAAMAQPAQKFEAADVHASAAGATEDGGFLAGGRVEFRATTLLKLISVAHSIPTDRIFGGPSWIDTDRFDILAKAPAAATPIAMRHMLQNLLEERFGVSVKTEDKPAPVFVLLPARPGIAKKSSGEGEPQCRRSNEGNVLTLTCRNLTMASLAERLPQTAAGYFNLLVVDRTGLAGTYDFTLEWTGRGQIPAGAEFTNGASLFVAIEKHLGTKVEKQTVPMPALTILSVNRKPTGNPPGTIDILGAPPTQFDVATVRPSRPDEQEDFKMTNGRIDAKAVSMRDWITFAYDVEDDWVRGGEKWLDSDKYDITAKSAPTTSTDTLRIMARALLEERFKLKVHKELQPVTVYALTAGKVKLKEADPSTRSTCKFGNDAGTRTYTCTNTTMEQLAARIRDIAAGYLNHPVVDLTGLKGSYDFVLAWAPVGRTMAMGRPSESPESAPGSAIPVASDRPRELTLFEAVERQLGLKLATQKHPMQVVVIDRMVRTPVEN